MKWIDEHGQQVSDSGSSHAEVVNKPCSATTTHCTDNVSVSIQTARNTLADSISDTADIEVDVPVGSIQIDLLCRQAKSPAGANFIGFDDNSRKATLTAADHDMMYRIGVPIIPLTLIDWTNNSSDVIAHIRSHFDEHIQSCNSE